MRDFCIPDPISSERAGKQIVKLRLEEVSYRYRNGPSILNDVSLGLDGPGLYGVIGPNGAGKTTFFDLVMGTRQPDRGRISFEGIASKSFLLQRTAFSDLLSLRENLELLSAIRGHNIVEAVASCLEQDGRGHLLPRRYGVLSGGEKRWFAVQCVIGFQSDLTIYDEPTAGIDTKFREKILQSISSAHQDGIVLVSSHDPADIEYMTSGTIRLDSGQIARQLAH